MGQKFKLNSANFIGENDPNSDRKKEELRNPPDRYVPNSSPPNFKKEVHKEATSRRRAPFRQHRKLEDTILRCQGLECSGFESPQGNISFHQCLFSLGFSLATQTLGRKST